MRNLLITIIALSLSSCFTKEDKEVIASYNEKDLFDKKIFSKNKGVLKLLNIGEIKDKINIEISYASKTAIEKIQKAGGNITLTKK